MHDALREFSTRATPQSEPMRSDQVQNSAGGHVWAVDNWTRLNRFLILGADGGTHTYPFNVEALPIGALAGG